MSIKLKLVATILRGKNSRMEWQLCQWENYFHHCKGC